MTDPSLNPEDLLVFESGLQSLAARLVGADLAEDLLQDTWVRALENPPRAHQPLGPWLVRVLSNLAISSHRRLSRQRRTEALLDESIDHPVGATSPEDVSIEVEAAERVLRTLSELDELPRTIITLRYLRGMPSGDIGSKLDLPASTVRWHLQNAVAKMRVALAQEGRDLHGGWAVGILPLLRSTRRSAPVKLGSTGFGGPWVLASVLVAFIGFLTVALSGPADPSSVESPASSAVALSTAASSFNRFEDRPKKPTVRPVGRTAPPRTIAVAAAVPMGLPPQETGLHRGKEQHPPSPSDEPDAETTNVEIFCRVVGEERAPVAGAELTLGGGRGGFSVAGPDGRLAHSGQVDPSMMGLVPGLEISAEGHAQRSLGWPDWLGSRISLGDVKLVEARTISGVVRDRDDRPIAGAAIYSRLLDDPLGAPTAWTDSSGRFKQLKIARSRAQVTARAKGYEDASVELDDDAAEQVELLLRSEDDGPTLSVQVQDPAGHPVSEAIVRVSRDGLGQEVFTADKHGDLLVPLSGPAVGDVTAYDPGLAFAPARQKALKLDGQREVLKLSAGHTFTFIIKSPEGPLLNDFRWAQFDSLRHPTAIVRHGEVRGSTGLTIAIDLEGEGGLRDEGLMLLADGFAPATVDFRSLDPSQKQVVVLLSPERLVKVSVSHNGAPFADATASLTLAAGGLLGGPIGAQEAQHSMQRTYKSDPDGNLFLPEFAYQPFTLRVSGGNLAPWFHHHPGMGTPMALTAIELEPGGTVVGSSPAPPPSHDASGDVPSGVRYFLEATHTGSGRVRETEVGASPYYELYGLEPGRWTLRWLRSEGSKGTVEVEGPASATDVLDGCVTLIARS